jgi:imidazolonepropionase-like amidohydrolase
VVAPGQVIEGGTLVLRDGVIAAVGTAAEVKVPADARLWALPGKTLYPGLVEPLSEAHLAAGLKAEAPAAGGGRAGAAAPAEAPNNDEAARSWNPKVTPERSVARGLVAD